MTDARRFRPWLTWSLLGVFAGLFLLLERAGGSERPHLLLQFGAHQRALTFGGQPWRLMSAGMLHIGFWHLFMNGWALLVLGPMLERRYGPRTLWMLVSLSIVGGFLTSSLFVGQVTAGASGGLFGLLGACVLIHFRERATVDPAVRRAREGWLISLAVSNLALALMLPQINHAAHFGGAVVGMAAAAILRGERREGRVQAAAGWLMALCSLGALVLAARDAARVADRPWDFPVREWRDPQGRYAVAYPVWAVPHLQEDGLQAFRAEWIEAALGVDVHPAAPDWKLREAAHYANPVDFEKPRSWDEGDWFVIRTVILGGNDIEIRHQVRGDLLFRLMLRADGRIFESLRPRFLEFVASFRAPP